MVNIKTGIECSNSNAKLSGVVLEYVATMKRLFDQAKQPDFKLAQWAPLAELVAVDKFEWIGPSREVLNWQGYLEYLTQWTRTMEWKSAISRIHEWQTTVFLETEDQYSISETVDVVRTIVVFEFNEVGKVLHIAVYVQKIPTLGL